MRDQSLDEFITEWKPLIRPDGLAEALLSAYGLRPNDRDDVSRLPAIFAEYDQLWLRELGADLCGHPQVQGRLAPSDVERLNSFLDTHRRFMRLGRFGSDYLDSIEDIGLFFLYHEVMPLWVISCFDQVKNRLLETIQEESTSICLEEQLALTKGVTTATLVDSTQFQRVYNFYDHTLAEETKGRRLAITDFDHCQQTARNWASR